MDKCQHAHLVFEDGELYIRCIDCNRCWGGVSRKGGMFDYTLMATTPLVDKFRHSSFETPRREPKK